MRSRTSNWFEVGIRYQKTQEDGSEKSVTEKYAIDALSFTEGESAITEEMAAYISGEFKVKSMQEASYNEVFFSNKDDDDRWYKAKLIFITFDEKSGKERHSNFTYLVQAKSMQRALNNIDEVMNNSMIDYDVVGLSETKICDVFEHKVQTSKKKEE
mgnify:CR=1 FL=1